MKPGDKIKIFPDTCVPAYVEFIHAEGFRCKIYRDHLLVGEPFHKPIDRRKTGRTITQIRRKNNMSRDDMALAIGVRHETIWNWEIGRSLPDKFNQEKLKAIGWEGVVYED